MGFFDVFLMSTETEASISIAIYINESVSFGGWFDSQYYILSTCIFLCTTHNDRTHCSYELVYRIMLSCSRFLPVSTVCYFASFDPICQYIGIGGNTHKSQFPHRNYWHVDRDGMIRSSTSLSLDYIAFVGRYPTCETFVSIDES